jgi:general secretion pathway protein K
MQARFNLNNLASLTTQGQFRTLLHTLLPKVNAEVLQALAQAITHWVNPLSERSELDRYYAALPTPYYAAHRPMISVSELGLIKGFTPAIYEALAPYVTALPQITNINVQTASAPVLMTLNAQMTPDIAEKIIRLRATTPFVYPEKAVDSELLRPFNILASQITVTSGYFLLTTEVSIEKQRLVLYTLLERAAHGDKAIINILWQTKGTW